MKKVVASLLSLFALLVLFQNCGEISLGEKQTLNSVFFRMSGEFCPSVSVGSQYSLQEFYVINLTARVSRFSGKFLVDSDMDGISDIEEIQYGFDPLNRRSFGVLDSICLDAGAVNCDPGVVGNYLSFGLIDSDISANNGNPGTYGEDQDQDKIPDFLEILFGTLLNNPDGDISSDQPGATNIEEIQAGLAPRSTLDSNIDSSFLVRVSTRLNLDIDCPNASAGYEFGIEQLPLAQTAAFSSMNEPYLNHAENENMILFLVVSTTTNGAQEITYALRKVSYDNSQTEISIQPSDFQNIFTQP